MFEVKKNEQYPQEAKKALNTTIVESAFKEIEEMVRKYGETKRTVIAQMIYKCLDRDQLTGKKLPQKKKE